MNAPRPDKAPPSVLCFLKAPRLGTVKTRLARSIGADNALALYRELGAAQLARLPQDWTVEVHFTPRDAVEEMRSWLGDGYPLYPQSEGDLGARLNHAVQGAFARGAPAVACVGADCPQLGASHLLIAARQLAGGADLAIGPTEDGGYYLIAMSRFQSCVFKNIPWSADDTLEATRRAAKRAGLRLSLLPTLFDIDELADLQKAVLLGLAAPDKLPQS